MTTPSSAHLRSRTLLASLFGAGLLGLSACAPLNTTPAHVAADRVFINGQVLTVDAADAQVQSIAIKNGKVLRVGSNQDTQAVRGENTEVIDLRGKTVIPGIQDTHSHFTYSGMLSFQVDLNSPPIGTVQNMAQLQARIRDHMQANPSKKWVTGFGYDDTLLAEKRHPTKADLDAVSATHPILITHVSGHLAVANTAALTLAGITKSTAAPAGGVIRLGADGQPNGVLEETAVNMVGSLEPPMSAEQSRQALEIAARTYASQGITMATDSATSVATITALEAMAQQGRLPIRIAAEPTLEELEAAYKLPLTSGMVRVTGIKEFGDGSIQGYTGYLSQPYYTPFNGDASYRGFPRSSRDELARRVAIIYGAGKQVQVHGNGDAAIDDILFAFEAAQAKYPNAKVRPVVIHSQMMREDQLDRLQALGGIPSFFVLHTYYWGDRHRDIFMGPERAARMSPLASALKRGMRFTLHTDTPVVPIEPMRLMWSAVNRVSTSGQVIGAAQRVTAAQALRSLTLNAAYQHFEEAERGSLEVGKYADMVILSGNPVTSAPMAIKDIQVLETIVEGKTVYQRKP